MLSEKDALIELLTKQNSELLKQIDSLNNQIENLTEMILQMRKDKFGSSSEKTPRTEVDAQLFMSEVFNEVEVENNPDAPENIRINAKDHVRVNPKTKKELVLSDLPVVDIICDADEGQLQCPQCGGNLKKLGNRVIRKELQYIPAQLKVLRYIQTTYECPKCKHTDHPSIVKIPVPKSLLNHSLASPSSVAYIIYEKYVNASPLYRQEQNFRNLGLDLSRGTMANWVIRCAEDYLSFLTEYLRRELLSRDIIHCDETPVQVLKEPGKSPQSKSYMWVYRTGNDGKNPIILFDYKPSRSGENAADYLKDFKGYVHSDGYSGYNKLSGIIRCGCWVHLRRKFVEAIPGKSASGTPKASAEIGKQYCDRLFHIESKLEDLSPEDRYIKRLELEKPVLDEFWRWLDELTPLNGSALGRAVKYAKNQKPYMENYLLDGRLNISNNPAENAIRPFTVGRKNWLFSDTQVGARASATIYSLIETAKANGINVYRYLNYVLEIMPNVNFQANPAILESLMPWNERAREKCGE